MGQIKFASLDAALFFLSFGQRQSLIGHDNFDGHKVHVKIV